MFLIMILTLNCVPRILQHRKIRKNYNFLSAFHLLRNGWEWTFLKNLRLIGNENFILGWGQECRVGIPDS